MPDGLATGAVAAAAVSAGAVIAVEPSAALIAPGRSRRVPRGRPGAGPRAAMSTWRELRLIHGAARPPARPRAR